MNTLHIGGRLVQIGGTIDDITLVKDQLKLRSLGYYHGWSVNGIPLTDNENITNLANLVLQEFTYFDGISDNIFLVKGGLTSIENELTYERIRHK